MEEAAKTRLLETAAFIDRHLAETPNLSADEGRLTGRESEILAAAASHREFLEFIRWHLKVPLAYSMPQDRPEHFAPGHFDRFMLRMAMKPRTEGEAVLEYGEPISFLMDGVDAPDTTLFRAGPAPTADSKEPN